MKSRAAIVEAVGAPFTFADVDIDACRDDEILVEIAAVGICHTDLAIRNGDFPIPPTPVVLGHEGAGRVLGTGSGVTKVQAGDHVVLSFASCGRCGACAGHQPARCAAFVPLNMGGSRADGSFVHSRGGVPLHGSFFGQSSFARHAVVSARNAVKVPKDIPLDLLCPLGCGIQTGAGTILNHIRPAPGSHVAIFGAGAVGLAAIMAAKIAGCATIVAIDLHAGRRALAAEIGATHAIDARVDDVATAIRAIRAGGVDHVVECSGAPAAFEAAVQSIRQGGTVSLVGVPRADARVSVPYMALMAGSIQAVIEGDSDPDSFIPALIDHYRAGRLPFDRLITRYDFADINEAMADTGAGRTIKPVLLLDGV